MIKFSTAAKLLARPLLKRRSRGQKKTLSLIIVLILIMSFQNCGEFAAPDRKFKNEESTAIVSRVPVSEAPPAGHSTPPTVIVPTYCGDIDMTTVVPDVGASYITTLFADGGDNMATGHISKVIVYENNKEIGTAHSQHVDIRNLGRGRFSHWYNNLYFSASDNSNPKTNGRKYSYGVTSGSCPNVICGKLDMSQVIKETGANYISNQYTGLVGDTTAAASASPLRLYENGIELSGAHSQHADIRNLGRGRFSKWGPHLYFSSSDNSDPRANGRTYTYGATECNRLQLTVVDRATTTYATFQSNYQKVVSNQYGFFMTYLQRAGETPGATSWRLVGSKDGGRSFQTFYESSSYNTKAPMLETDDVGNLYVAHANWQGANGVLYIFSPNNNYASPITTASIPNFGSVGKYAMILDTPRNFIYIASWTNITRINLMNGATNTVELLKAGSFAGGQYPSLSLSPDGTLFYGWTTVVHDNLYQQHWGIYHSIHFIYSRNGGTTWETPGQSLALPIAADESGPGILITSADDLAASRSADSSNWLSNMAFKNGKIHFMYTRTDVSAGRYVRYSFDQDVPHGIDQFQSHLGGANLSISSLGGFFASSPQADSPLYATGRNGDGHINVIMSQDNGGTWQDVATSTDLHASPYATGGARQVASDGSVIGSFTDATRTSDGFYNVYFMRLAPQLKNR